MKNQIMNSEGQNFFGTAMFQYQDGKFIKNKPCDLTPLVDLLNKEGPKEIAKMLRDAEENYCDLYISSLENHADGDDDEAGTLTHAKTHFIFLKMIAEAFEKIKKITEVETKVA